MQSQERLSRRFSLALLLGLLFIANACAPQPTREIENSDNMKSVYVLCGDANLNGGCEPGDYFISDIPVDILHKDGTIESTVTDKNGSISHTMPEETGVNIDLEAAEEQTGLCRTNLREIEDGSTTIYFITFTLCDTTSS